MIKIVVTNVIHIINKRVYIYIEREREREREFINVHTLTHACAYI